MTPRSPSLRRITSGGQTGVDRGALDAALLRAFPCGGWCPQGRRAEDGPIPARFPLDELAGAGYAERTDRNVGDSDATVILHFGPLAGGTRRTLEQCRRQGRAFLVLNGACFAPREAAERLLGFLERHAVRVLNVAGPRASEHPGGESYAAAMIDHVLGGFPTARDG